MAQYSLSDHYAEKLRAKGAPFIGDPYEVNTPCLESPIKKQSHGYARGHHRSEFIKKWGWISKCIEVCHKCDNRACINLDHLAWGTHADNMLDASRKSKPRLYNRAGSKFWWYDFYFAGKRYRGSTKLEDEAEALIFAENLKSELTA